MEKQRWEESEKRRAEERRSERRKSEKKEEAGARKGSKVAKHCVFPTIWGSGGSKSRLAKAAGAEPAGQMRAQKIARRCGAKHISKPKCAKHTRFGPLLDMQVPFSVASAVETAPCQARAKREGCAADAKTRAGMGRFRKYCKDAFRVAGPCSAQDISIG